MPQFDLGAQNESIRDALQQALLEVVDSGQFILGPQAEAFEREVATHLGVAEAVGCNSGTDALHLALLAAGIGPGDEVITTPFTFIATAEAIAYTGATPVFVDIDPDTFNVDPARVAEAVGPRTRALLPVHLYGQPAALDALLEIAANHKLELIEDCAQSFGARRGGQFTGSFGASGCFSFFPTKNLGAFGDAGMITTNSAETADKLRVLRNHGARRRHDHPVLGFNSRLDELQAAVLRIKLRHVAAYNAARVAIARRYDEAFADLPGVTTPRVDPAGDHVYGQYTVLLRRRDTVAAHLQAAGVGCAVHYPRPLHLQPSMRSARVSGSLHVAEDVAGRCLSLPMFPELDDAAVERVIAAVRNAVAAEA